MSVNVGRYVVPDKGVTPLARSQLVNLLSSTDEELASHVGFRDEVALAEAARVLRKAGVRGFAPDKAYAKLVRIVGGKQEGGEDGSDNDE